MLGSGEIDSVRDEIRVRSFAVDGATGASLFRIAERLATQPFDCAALHGVDAGDALALATRLDCGWAYRGQQALLWKSFFHAHEVHDRYLPSPLLRPFDRRGLLEVRGERNGKPLALVAAQFSTDRIWARELRFVRHALRSLCGETVLFLAHLPERFDRIGVADLGFVTLQRYDDRATFVRGSE